MSTRTYSITASALTVLIFILSTLWTQSILSGARADFTENKLYSLSDGTRAVLSDLAEPVEITFVYSGDVAQDFPAIRAYAARVREVLDAYSSVAGRSILLREVDPKPFSEAEDEALAGGVTAIDSGRGDPLYFGIIGRNAVDDEAVIPFLAPDREASLEYDLTRLIARLDDPDPPVVGVLTALPALQGDGRSGGYFLLQEMAKTFAIERIPADFVDLPDTLDVLLIVHPEPLTDWQAWLVDQFVLKTGRLIYMTDPAVKAAASDPFAIGGPPKQSDFGRLGDHWGVTLSDFVVADVATALPVETDTEGRSNVVGQPLFMAIPPNLTSADDLATADIGRALHFGASGALRARPPDTAVFTTLVRTSQSPSSIDADLALGPADPSAVVAQYDAQDAPFVLAGRLVGALRTAFPDGAPTLDVPEDPVLAEALIARAGRPGSHIAESEREAQIIFIADADIVDDGFYVDPASATTVADNAAFILNALDGLAGGAELLSLRARQPGTRPMTRVENLRARAEARYFDEQARLQARLSAAQDRLSELQAIGARDGFYAGDLEADLTRDEREELADLRTTIVNARTRLRDVEADFRSEIDGLEATLKAVNIWGGAGLVALIGVFVWWRGRRRPAP
ncbi:MAG: Gldg family protein [Pseudomonadota bacterium]